MIRNIQAIRGKEIRKCQNCGSSKSYTNPFWRCFECKGKFCPNCIWGGQTKTGMKEGEELRDICDKCRGKGYSMI